MSVNLEFSNTFRIFLGAILHSETGKVERETIPYFHISYFDVPYVFEVFVFATEVVRV